MTKCLTDRKKSAMQRLAKKCREIKRDEKYFESKLFMKKFKLKIKRKIAIIETRALKYIKVVLRLLK